MTESKKSKGTVRPDIRTIRLRLETRKRLETFAHLQARSVWRVADHILSQYLDEKIGCQFYSSEGRKCNLKQCGVKCGGIKAACEHPTYKSGELYV